MEEVDPQVRAATILVVDDTEANRALAQNALEDEGYRVVVAAGGEEGLAAFERESPDCVLLDVHMPHMDGFTVCERIRASPQGVETPVLFLTALRDVDTFDRALRVGGDDFLTKPVRPTELLVRVQTALNLRRVRFELREHYDLLKKERDALLRMQLQKERLMAFVVHDLKNPVNAMDLHAQLLLREKGMSPSAHDSAGQIRAAAKNLTRMILNLLDLSKSDEGKLRPRSARVDLPALVDEVIAELSVNGESRKVTFKTCIAEAHAYADEDLLRRMLANLVENATRYSPPESVITVSAAAVDGCVELRVRDSGTGVPVDMREKIFDPFVQIDSGERTTDRGGRGLGLAFCKLVATAHGGQIWIEDGAPGAIFCVRIPNAD